jgi:hypothetical protein
MISLFHLFSFTILLFNSYTFSTATPAEKAILPKTVHPTIETDDYLSWSYSRPLTWDDFLCEPKRNTDAVALTSTALGIAYNASNGKLHYEITCNFSKIKSWGILKTSYILAHEQGHFDITEIYARILHRELLSYKFTRRTFRQDVNQIYDRVVKEKEAFQLMYDSQTDHSRNKKVQQEWLDKIQGLLTETEPYSDYP